ncbi:MAG: hypothetical protein K8S87_00830, partial [Planctomycetes bacterium]|nr:hypothetical protein [Planctomycetota bacterium]
MRLNFKSVIVCFAIIVFLQTAMFAQDAEKPIVQTNNAKTDNLLTIPNLNYTDADFLDRFEFGFRLTYIYIQNLGTKSTVSASPMRLRFFAKTEVFEDFFFNGALEFVDGKRTLGSVGLLVPHNMVSTDGYYREYDAEKPFTEENGYTSDPEGFYWEQDRTNFIIVDKAQFNWQVTSWFEVILGFGDTLSYERSGDGLATNYASRGGEGGFISQHFIYPLAYTGIDKRNNPRVGITAFKISVDDWFINRSY